MTKYPNFHGPADDLSGNRKVTSGQQMLINTNFTFWEQSMKTKITTPSEKRYCIFN